MGYSALLDFSSAPGGLRKICAARDTPPLNAYRGIEGGSTNFFALQKSSIQGISAK